MHGSLHLCPLHRRIASLPRFRCGSIFNVMHRIFVTGSNLRKSKNARYRFVARPNSTAAFAKGHRCKITPSSTNARRNCRVPRGGKRSPDSDFVRTLLRKSCLDSHCGPQNIDFTSNSGGGTSAGGTIVHPGPATPDSVYYRHYREPPIASVVGGRITQSCLPGPSWGLPVPSEGLLRGAFGAAAAAPTATRGCAHGHTHGRTHSPGRGHGSRSSSSRNDAVAAHSF
jgi:hypothetical protein